MFEEQYKYGKVMKKKKEKIFSKVIFNDSLNKLRANVGRKVRKYCQLRDLIIKPNGDIVAHCIACGREQIIRSSYELKKWHSSHFWNEDRYESVALHEWNINLCCFVCNRINGGNKSTYQENLRIKIGDKNFEELSILKNETKIYSYGELQMIDKIYSDKIKKEQSRLGKKW